MENLSKGFIFGLGLGMVAGAIIVSKNKKISTKIKEGVDMVEEKFEDLKDMAEKKIKEAKKEKEETEIEKEIFYDDDLKSRLKKK